MKKVHFIGIGGTGLSAIARILVEQGYTVTGSDRVLSPLALELVELGVGLFEGQAPQNIAGADLVIRSSAIPDDNPEVVAARASGIPVLKRADFLRTLMTGRECIAIAGTHGKTTTTAMLAWTLTRLGQDPSFIVGGVLKNLDRNAHAGKGSQFVIEADEYDRMFLGLEPTRAVVTIVEYDHPDCFPTLADYQKAFKAFVKKLLPGGMLFVCQDDPGAVSLLTACPASCTAFSYGLTSSADYSAAETAPNTLGGTDFSLYFKNSEAQTLKLTQVRLQVPGLHNVQNACAVLAVIHQSGLPIDQAAAALQEFAGTGRRFDLRGEPWGVALIDDYAHHPTEIRTTLAAARQRYPGRRIWAVWQPHTYSRTQTLLESFTTAFNKADRVLVTDVYAARESNAAFSSAQVVERMTHSSARHAGSLDAAVDILLAELEPGDVVLVLSAGDADQISERVYAQLKQREVIHG
jgi:UDP-N-acetylmuramate--alanine ligase